MLKPEIWIKYTVNLPETVVSKSYSNKIKIRLTDWANFNDTISAIN